MHDDILIASRFDAAVCAVCLTCAILGTKRSFPACYHAAGETVNSLTRCHSAGDKI